MRTRPLLTPDAALAGCASDDTSAGTSSPPASSAGATATGSTVGSEADIAFAQLMIVMAQQVAETTTNPEVGELADAIITGQTAEIATMSQVAQVSPGRGRGSV